MSELRGSAIRKEDLAQSVYEEIFAMIVKDIGEASAMKVVARLADHFGGQQVYFQSCGSITRAARDRAIKSAHDGSPESLKEIARENQLSMSFVREILKSK